MTDHKFNELRAIAAFFYEIGGTNMYVNPFKTFRIDVVFFLGFAIIIVILVGLIVVFNYVSSSKEIANNTSYYQQKLLIELHKKLNTQLEDIEQSSNTAAQNLGDQYEDLLNGSPYERLRRQVGTREQLNNYVFSMPTLHSIHLYSDLDPSYNVQDYVQFLSIEQLEHEQWYGELRNSDYTWLSERTIQTNSGDEPVIGFARKVYNRFNRSFAIVVFNVKVSVFQSLITTEDNRSNLALFDANGKLITYTGNDSFFVGREGVIQQYLETQRNGSKKEGDEFVVWSSSPDSQWSLVEVTSWSQITAGSLRQATIILALGIVTILLILLLTVFLSKQFVKPIDILLQAMSRFSLTTQSSLPKEYKNEFGKLFQGYEDLTSRMEELYRNLDEQHEKRRASEMKALQMTIHPHFLYNSLDQVNWLAIEANQPKISHMLSYLAQFFRLALSNDGSLVKLDEEIKHIESYLNFQKIRWDERLEFLLDIPQDVREVFVPKIILQPFVENAFIHGFHGKDQALLLIQAQKVHNRLHISIIDNGRQLPADWATKRSAKGGYGLQNVSERIQAAFGDHYGFTLSNSSKGGTQAIISLPLLYSDSTRGGNKDVESSHH